MGPDMATLFIKLIGFVTFVISEGASVRSLYFSCKASLNNLIKKKLYTLF
jgi:hypothetical protein